MNNLYLKTWYSDGNQCIFAMIKTHEDSTQDLHSNAGTNDELDNSDGDADHSLQVSFLLVAHSNKQVPCILQW